MRGFMILAALLSAATTASARPGGGQAAQQAGKQTSEIEQQAPALPPITGAESGGMVARSSVGQAGQRQTRAEAFEGTAPMNRIANRIQNRVQSRLRNRIDREYDPTANATSPFEEAQDQTRVTGKPKR